jgi:hypothetical protein
VGLPEPIFGEPGFVRRFSSIAEIALRTYARDYAKQENDTRIQQQNGGCPSIKGRSMSQDSLDVFARTKRSGQSSTNAEGREVDDQRTEMLNCNQPIKRGIVPRSESPECRELHGEAYQQPRNRESV